MTDGFFAELCRFRTRLHQHALRSSKPCVVYEQLRERPLQDLHASLEVSEVGDGVAVHSFDGAFPSIGKVAHQRSRLSNVHRPASDTPPPANHHLHRTLGHPFLANASANSMHRLVDCCFCCSCLCYCTSTSGLCFVGSINDGIRWLGIPTDMAPSNSNPQLRLCFCLHRHDGAIREATDMYSGRFPFVHWLLRSRYAPIRVRVGGGGALGHGGFSFLDKRHEGSEVTAQLLLHKGVHLHTKQVLKHARRAAPVGRALSASDASLLEHGQHQVVAVDQEHALRPGAGVEPRDSDEELARRRP
mmetsp:Transcript_8066/g.15256  ORF Transcript_8066/g.15256 Transcript_8066/m.15256 type:complete len:302 (+) Transcript_8066:265-1170(+)